MDDEIVKTDRAADYAARAAKARATKLAKAAAEMKKQREEAIANPLPPHKTAFRQHKQAEEEGPAAAASGGSRLNAKTGRVEAIGRDGQVLSRTTILATDQFEVPKHLWPKGWDYQWNTISVHGNADIARNMVNHMQQQGWAAVPAERYAGTLLPKNAKGAIVRDGMILEERPTSLGDEARAEDLANAKKLISDRNESLKLAGVKQGMPQGYEMSSKYKGTGGDIRMSIDKALDAPAPSYTLANPGDE